MERLGLTEAWRKPHGVQPWENIANGGPIPSDDDRIRLPRPRAQSALPPLGRVVYNPAAMAVRNTERLMDLRTINRNLRSGLLAREEVTEYLRNLPDASDKLEVMTIPDDDESEAAKAEGEQAAEAPATDTAAAGAAPVAAAPVAAAPAAPVAGAPAPVAAAPAPSAPAPAPAGVAPTPVTPGTNNS